MDTIFGRIALLAVLGVLAIPLLGAVRDTGDVMQPGCELPGRSERFVAIWNNGSSVEVRQEQGGERCFVIAAGTGYETPGGEAVEIDGGFIAGASWGTPDGVVSALGGRLILPFWSVGVGVVMVLGAAGAIILHGRT